MIHILAIVGSPKVKGNTDLLVAEALKAAAEVGAETELLRLADKEIKPCNAYMSCRKTGECVILDEFAP